MPMLANIVNENIIAAGIIIPVGVVSGVIIQT